MLTLSFLLILGFYEVQIKAHPLPDAARPNTWSASASPSPSSQVGVNVDAPTPAPWQCRVIDGQTHCGHGTTFPNAPVDR